MVSVFFIFLLLADLLHPALDKVPVLFFGMYGLLVLLVKRKTKILIPEMGYLLFLFSMCVTAVLVDFSGNTIAYLVLFCLQLGVFSYVIFQQKRDRNFINNGINSFINWNIVIGVVGLLDFLAYSAGVITPIRDYFYSFKVDSFYANPNVFGMMASFSIIFMIRRNSFRRFDRKDMIKMGVLSISIILSTSSMALGLPLIYLVVQRFSLSKAILLSVAIMSAILLYELKFGFENIPIQVLLNKRLELWISAFQMWSEAPLFGVGTGNFQLQNTVVFEGRAIGSDFGLHSLYLWLIIETGIVGSACFVLFLVSIIYRSTQFTYSKYSIPIFGMLLFSQLTEFYLEHEEVFMLLFWLIVTSLILPTNLYLSSPRQQFNPKWKQHIRAKSNLATK